jgi:CDP-glucose 4,6-dehydratase
VKLVQLEGIKKSGRPVLVTGHTGFKGTWLTLLLEYLGIEVVGYSLEPEENTLFERLDRQGKVYETFSDIRDLDQLEKFLNTTRPEVVFHLAAQPLVMESYSNPRDTFDVNLMGTVNLLDASRRVDSVKCNLVSTTDKVYKNSENKQEFTEMDPLQGKDPYSASKVGVENIIIAYQNLAKISDAPKVTALRSGNVIGGGDISRNRLIPDLVKSFNHDSSVIIRSPESTRPWQHALDPLLGYVLTAEALLNEIDIPAINFGPTEKALSVIEVANLSKSTWGSNSNIIVQPNNNLLEAKNLELDSTYAQKTLKWNPSWSQESAVIETISWWKSVLVEKMPAYDRSIQDIKFLFEEK